MTNPAINRVIQFHENKQKTRSLSVLFSCCIVLQIIIVNVYLYKKHKRLRKK